MRPTFTVFGPYSIEPEDVPTEVVAAVLNPTTSWQVIVEGSTAAAIPLARRFAKELARAAAGVAVDEQADEILGEKTARKVNPPPRRPSNTLSLHWHSPVSASPPPSLWLEVARLHLPEAIPRRFGSWEPMRFRLDRDGEEKLLEIYRDALMFTAKAPCLRGGMYSYDGKGLQQDVLSIVSEPMDDPHWRKTVRRFFVDYARRRRSVFATGEICRDGHHDQQSFVHRHEGVLGLFQYPIWWTWFGTDYVPLVRDYLPAEHTTVYDEGVLYAPSDAPADRRQLADLLPYPFPADLQVTVEKPGNSYNLPRFGPAAIRLVTTSEPPLSAAALADKTLRDREIEEARRTAYDWIDEPPAYRPSYADIPDQWPPHLHRMRRELAAADIDVDTAFHLYQQPVRYEAAMRIMIDWLEHLDDRVPAGQYRDDLRYALVRNLACDYVFGKGGIEVLSRQFDIEPMVDREVLRFAAWALREASAPSDIGPTVALIERHEDSPPRVYQLMRSLPDHPDVVPIMLDWLEHLTDRIPADRPHARDYIRHTVLHRLETKYARGNQRAVELVSRQFFLEPPLRGLEVTTAQDTLARIARQSDFDRVAAVIDNYPSVEPGPFLLFRWVGRIKTVKARQFALRHLANPRYRAMAVAALADQKADGVAGE